MGNGELKVWVLAGQSNMEGCGQLKGCMKPDPRVMNFTSAGAWEQAVEPLHKLWESYTPVHQLLLREWNPDWTKGKTDDELAKEANASRTHGAGLGLPFGMAMADLTGCRIGLIPCAHGGTSMDQWSPDLAPEKGTASFYGAMVDRINKAGGELQGVLWYQGESDCSPGLAETYISRFKHFVECLRRDTGKPGLPVIVVQLGTFVGSAKQTPEMGLSWDKVRDALVEAAMTIPQVGVVSAMDLALTDLIHISTPSQKRLGKRMARVAHALLTGEGATHAPRMTGFTDTTMEPSADWANHSCVLVRFTGITGSISPQEHIAGFQALGADGLPHPDTYVIDAMADFEDPASVRLILNKKPDRTVWIGYGRGLAPYCNAVDSEDMGVMAGIAGYLA